VVSVPDEVDIANLHQVRRRQGCALLVRHRDTEPPLAAMIVERAEGKIEVEGAALTAGNPVDCDRLSAGAVAASDTGSDG